MKHLRDTNADNRDPELRKYNMTLEINWTSSINCPLVYKIKITSLIRLDVRLVNQSIQNSTLFEFFNKNLQFFVLLAFMNRQERADCEMILKFSVSDTDTVSSAFL